MSGDRDPNEMTGDELDALTSKKTDKTAPESQVRKKLAAYLSELSVNSAGKTDPADTNSTGITEEDIAKQSATQEFAALIRERFSHGSPPPEAKPREKKLLLPALAALPAMLLAVLLAINLSHPQQSMKLSGTIEAKEITLACKVTGRVNNVLVEEGQVVRAGQPLVEIALPELQAQREKQQAEIELREARLLELRNGARSAELARARALADQAYLNWRMLKSGYRAEDIGMANAQRQEAERQLALLQTGYRIEEVDQAQAQMEEKKTHLQWAERDYERYQLLASDGAVSVREADEMKTRRDEAKSALDAASKNYAKYRVGPRADEILAARERLKFSQEREHMMLKGPRPEEIGMAWQQYAQAKAALDLLSEGTRFEQIAQSKAALEEAKAALAELDAQLEDKTICSPADAEVSVMDLHKGQILAANKPVLKLTRLDNMWIRLYIPEHQLSRVRMGQKVDLTADSFPGKTFHGKIVQIPSTAEFTPRNIQTSEERASQVFGLKVAIDNRQRLLRGGMNAEIVLPAAAPAPRCFGGLALWPQ